MCGKTQGSIGLDRWTHGNQEQSFENVPNDDEYVQVNVVDDEEQEIEPPEVVYEEEENVVSSQPIVPYEGMKFDMVDEAKQVYNEYAYKMGFSIRVASSRRSTKTKELIRKEFECSHAWVAAGKGEQSASSLGTRRSCSEILVA